MCEQNCEQELYYENKMTTLFQCEIQSKHNLKNLNVGSRLKLKIIWFGTVDKKLKNKDYLISN